MSKILISYRREDSADVTGRIYDRLIQAFPTAVFRDVDSVPLGVDFRTYLDEQVAECDVFLAVIGPDWMGPKDSMGKARLENPEDYVRIEIESALKRQIRVIPVLVRGASIPSAKQLPESLQGLSYRNGMAVRSDPDFHRDIDRLIEQLKTGLQSVKPRAQVPDVRTQERENDKTLGGVETHLEREQVVYEPPSAKKVKQPPTQPQTDETKTAQLPPLMLGGIGLIVLIGAVVAFLLLQPKPSPVTPPPVVEKKEERLAQGIPPPFPSRPPEPGVVPKKPDTAGEKKVIADKPRKVAEKKEERTAREITPPSPTRPSKAVVVPKEQDKPVEEQVTAKQSSIPSPRMIRISPGSFMMGGSGWSREAPVHQVQLSKPFLIARYETTFEEYDRFAHATDRQLPSDKGWGRGSRPVINIAWKDAKDYAQWLSQQTGKRYRLPTESEWEYAARAGTTTRYWWGDEIGTNQANCDGCGSKWDNKQTAPVGSFLANKFSLYEMSGNVWEWVEDCWHENYEGGPSDGSPWLETNGGNCGLRVIRGGSWDMEPDFLSASSRYRGVASLPYSYIGFRLAQDIP